MQINTPAKINIFLKIVGTRGSYHELISRFVRYDELYDTITFVPGKFEHFTIEGIQIPREENIVYKAFVELNRYTQNPKILDFFYNHKVVIEKRIPLGAGLGGGSSNAAGFIKLLNDVLNLHLSTQELVDLGSKLGADVPFFIIGCKSANVFGIGEKIEPFDDDIPPLRLKLMPFSCNTAQVYRRYREKFMTNFEIGLAKRLCTQKSREILATITPTKANDLFLPAIDLCNELEQYQKEYFLSGSGSTLFRRRDESCSHQ